MKENILAAQRFLLRAQNEDGGWPYRPGAQSSPEPTCYSLLALNQTSDIRHQTSDQHPIFRSEVFGLRSEVSSGLGWLRSRLNEKSALTLEGDTEPHWTTSLWVVTLAKLSLNDEFRRQNDEQIRKSVHHSSFIIHRSVEWLLTWEGRRLAREEDIAVDSTLRGWPWISETFSWVEPTSLALLALKMCGQKNHPRVAEAERLLIDRACKDGGWNYGNHTALGATLVAYVPTSALAALALQDVAAAGEVVDRGLAFMDREIQSRQSALSLALTILCFNVFGKVTTDLAQALCHRQEPDGSWRQQVHVTALAMLALEATGGENVFKL